MIMRELKTHVRPLNFVAVLLTSPLLILSSTVVPSGCPFQVKAADDGAPEIVILSPQNTTYRTASVGLTFTISEEAPWIGYSLDSEENVTVAGNTTLAGLSEGGHSVLVFANGTSGFVGSSERVYFTVSPLHDVAVISISVPFDNIYSGETISLSVTVGNEGTVWESFNVTAYYNDTIIETRPVINLTQGFDAVLYYSWNTSTVPAGIYTVRANATVIPGELDVANNVLTYGAVRLYPKPLMKITPSMIEAMVKQDFEIEVWIVNVTNLYHYEFSLRYNSSMLYINEVIICDEYGMFLRSPYAESQIRIDAANNSVYISLTQSSGVTPVNGTGQLSNIKISIAGTILYSWKPNVTNSLNCSLALEDSKIGVKFKDTRLLEQRENEILTEAGHYSFTPVPGDLNLDGVTDVIDLCAAAKKVGSTGQNPFDLNGDGIVDWRDLTLIASNINRTKP